VLSEKQFDFDLKKSLINKIENPPSPGGIHGSARFPVFVINRHDKDIIHGCGAEG
jgi:hypothetical protein